MYVCMYVCRYVRTSKPPISSQVMLGTSTTVSRREEGLETPKAYLKCSCESGSSRRSDVRYCYDWLTERGGVGDALEKAYSKCSCESGRRSDDDDVGGVMMMMMM